jgi:aerobic-type carbon monoxide dehydrogenase small subunit (CoxS/CutS family)
MATRASAGDDSVEGDGQASRSCLVDAKSLSFSAFATISTDQPTASTSAGGQAAFATTAQTRRSFQAQGTICFI